MGLEDPRVNSREILRQYSWKRRPCEIAAGCDEYGRTY